MTQAPSGVARVEAALQRRWYGRPGWLWLLWPLELLFRLVAATRRAAYRRGWRQAIRTSVPVVVVGNISVGGTGKTPVTIALCRALQQAGFRPGIASRGYGSRAAQFPLAITPATPVELAGDEPLLMARRSGVPVAIAPRRSDAVSLLAGEYGCDVVLCDDGLQHYGLARDIEWVVIDGKRRLGNGRCLPLGPLREPAARLRTVDAVLVNGGTPAPGEFRFDLQPGGIHPVGGGATSDLAAFAEQHPRVHAVAGIGHPERFFATLRASGLVVIEHPFPDHHAFTALDLAFADDLPVVMTEKDAVKCAALAGNQRLWYLSVEARLPPEPVARLLARLQALRSAHGN